MKISIETRLCAILSVAAAALILTENTAWAQQTGRNERKVRFDYDVAFETRFDNREYDHTLLDYSRTLFGARVQAAVGVAFKSGRATHRLLGGIDPLYEFGGGWTLKPLLYYCLDTRLKNCRFGIVAGAFPRSRQTALYSTAFYSDALRFHDNTVEGLQFSWDGRGYHYELGLDWMGMMNVKNPKVREEFAVYSGGRHTLVSALKLGYSARLHHYANNAELSADNVVDDILVNPYLEFDAGHYAGIQTLLARIGYLQALQKDRNVTSRFLTPAKGELLLEIRNWNVGLENDLFFGGDLMPYYGSYGPDGLLYGSSLYMGDPFMRNPEGKKFAVYDRLGIYYEPHIARNLTLRLQVNVHFNCGFAGHQEIIFLAYKLPESKR